MDGNNCGYDLALVDRRHGYGRRRERNTAVFKRVAWAWRCTGHHLAQTIRCNGRGDAHDEKRLFASPAAPDQLSVRLGNTNGRGTVCRGCEFAGQGKSGDCGRCLGLLRWYISVHCRHWTAAGSAVSLTRSRQALACVGDGRCHPGGDALATVRPIASSFSHRRSKMTVRINREGCAKTQPQIR